jgi:hypothetical protein
MRPGKNEESSKAIQNLFKTKGKLKITTAYFNNLTFTNLIIEREKNKRLTELLINTADIIRPQEPSDSQFEVAESLMAVLRCGGKSNYLHVKSLGLRAKGNLQNMHHKFIMTDTKVLVGSINLTNAAFHRNYESFIITTDSRTYNSFSREFDILWKKGKEILIGRRGFIRSLACPKCGNNEGIDFESYGPVCTYCAHRFIVK